MQLRYASVSSINTKLFSYTPAVAVAHLVFKKLAKTELVLNAAKQVLVVSCLASFVQDSYHFLLRLLSFDNKRSSPCCNMRMCLKRELALASPLTAKSCRIAVQESCHGVSATGGQFEIKLQNSAAGLKRISWLAWHVVTSHRKASSMTKMIKADMAW